MFRIARIFTLMVAVLAAAALTVVRPPTLAYACSCMAPPPPAEAAAQSSAVFAGTVAEVLPGANGLLVTFDVDTSWQGPAEPQLVLQTAGDSAMCGFSFVTGERYLVYAQGEGAELNTSLCSRTAPFDAAAPDVEALGAGTPVEPGSGEGSSAGETPAAEGPAGGMAPWVPLAGIGLLGLVAGVGALFVVRSRG